MRATPLASGDQAARIRRGDERAFNAMFRAYYASLCDFTNSVVHSPDVAEDIVQGVFVNIWESRRTWKPRSGVRAYLFGACRNRATDYLRHAHIVARSIERGETFWQGRGVVPAPADVRLEKLELAHRIRIAVAELPERRRLVVELRLTRQLSNREIALELGISVKGVETQFSRALLDLRRSMSGTRIDLA